MLSNTVLNASIIGGKSLANEVKLGSAGSVRMSSHILSEIQSGAGLSSLSGTAVPPDSR